MKEGEAVNLIFLALDMIKKEEKDLQPKEILKFEQKLLKNLKEEEHLSQLEFGRVAAQFGG